MLVRKFNKYNDVIILKGYWMHYIGIDQSYTSTGYCILDDNGIVDFGIYVSVPDDIYGRAKYIGIKLTELVNSYPESLVSIEGLAFGMRGSATRDLAGLQFVIIDRLLSNTHLKDIKIISPKSIKKFATGSGGSSKKKVTKKDMFASLDDYTQSWFKSRYKATKGLYDVTDAYYLAKYHQSEDKGIKNEIK